MTILPIAERELRTAARRPGAYRGRVLAALGATAITALAAYLQQYLPTAQLGQMLFVTLSGIVFLMALGAGAGFTADTISAERREGTLGLLFLTDLKPRDVIAGKLAVSSLGALYGIVATLPVLAIPLLLGGVTGAEYVRMMITIINILVWSLSVGLWVSTFQTEARTATTQTFVVLVASTCLAPAMGLMLGLWLEHRGIAGAALQMPVGALMCLSPGAAFVGCFDSLYRAFALQYLISNAAVLMCSALLLLAAGRRLPRCWQNEFARQPTGTLLGLFNPDASPADTTAPLRTRLLQSSPVVWLVCRRWWRRATPWLFLLVVALSYLGLGLWVGSDWWGQESYLGLSIFLHLILKVWIAGEAPRQIFEDRKSGAMELLLTTPLTDWDFIIGHVRALVRLFLRPLMVVGAVDLLLVLLTVTGGNANESLNEWVLMWILRGWFLVVDIVALVILGIWHGASTHRPRVNAYSFITVVVLPWLVIGAIATAVYARSQGPDPISFTAKLWIWWLVGTVIAGLFGFLDWNALNRRFRSVAATRPGAKPVNPPAA